MKISRTVNFTLITAFLLIVIILAIRPYNQFLYNKLYGIDVGSWVMYKYDLVPEYNLTLVSDNMNIDLNASDYIWHGSFGNSPHPHYNEDAMLEFVNRISKKEKIQKLIIQNDVHKIIFKMKLIKNKVYWKTVAVEKDL